MTFKRSEARSEGILRFDLAIQKTRLFVYSASVLTAIAGEALGVITVKRLFALLFWLAGAASTAVMVEFYRRGISRRVLNPVWMGADIILTTLGVYATGGSTSPWFIWYLATASAVAFVSGKRAAYLVNFLNAVAYIGVLMLMGEAAIGNDVFLLAVCRMAFLFSASYFFLAGIGDLQQKRLEIRNLELAESRKVEELTRLTAELNRRTEELAEANRRTQEADRLKSQFLANMSHELRTPMNSIIGFSEILIERLDGKVEEKQVGFMRHILASGQHLLGLISDILDLSKIEAGKMEIFPETFDPFAVITSVCQTMHGMTREPQPEVVIDIPPDLPRIETDVAKFRQILLNLLSNAAKFAPPDKPVTITARAVGSPDSDDGALTVSVRDEGIGIDPSNHDVIFQEFRQVDGTARRGFGGTGLGLALVKKFVELQGGYVTLESAPGRGSTFSFTLPLRSRAAIVSRGPQPPAGDAQAVDQVLVVEDDARAYELISSALSSAGYVSIRARHGEEALRLARANRPVAITLDLVLPGMDGWELLKQLKSDDVTREIPVVIVSLVDNRELGIALGADDYFVKPVDRDRFLGRIRSITSANAFPAKSRLLLIDDDEAVHSFLDAELARLGYAVESVYSGEEGLTAARRNTPDLIILDLMMPGMSGFEVAGALKDDAETRNIPILVLTSKDPTSAECRELQSKVASFVPKGASAREQLVREIRRLERRGRTS
ncbi:MAG TPA: response regulator [Thermoanaerobaculia bacterium]|nr:response regulator [Thermoanaerobaculia bacterium]